MAGREMAFEHLAAPAAIEADERLMNSRDQDRQLVGPDLVTADICSNNVGRAFSIER
jgi:hypothetical protein